MSKDVFDELLEETDLKTFVGLEVAEEIYDEFVGVNWRETFSETAFTSVVRFKLDFGTLISEAVPEEELGSVCEETKSDWAPEELLVSAIKNDSVKVFR